MRSTNGPHSCSISCCKEHKLTHAASKAPPTTKSTDPPQTAPRISVKQSQSVLQPPKDLQATSQALLDSPFYKILLSRYPNLRSDLLKIYKKTLEPPEAEVDEDSSEEERSKRRKTRETYEARGRGKGRLKGSNAPGRERPWNPEKARKKALRLLQNMTKKNKGVQEFGEVVKVVAKTEEPEK